MSEKRDAVLYVVEVQRPSGEWTPAWDGDGAASTCRSSAESWTGDPSLDGPVRVAVYVRKEKS